MKDTYIVVMAGGVGNRLYPLSTPETPKQFLNLYGDCSLLQHTCLRFIRGGYDESKIFVTTTREYVEQTVEHVEELLGSPFQVLFEPERKGTLHCVAYTVSLLPPGLRVTGDPVIAFVPADHFIRNPQEFIKRFDIATMIASDSDAVVLMGAKPEYPESGFGYMKIGVTGLDVDGFVEKPSNPEKYINDGYVWNTGVFIAKKSTYVKAIESEAFSAAHLTNIDPFTPMKSIDAMYSNLESKSFDSEVLQTYPNIQAVIGDFGWNDLGDYTRYKKLLEEGKLNEVRP